MKNKTVEKLMRFLITLLGAGIGAALAALILPLFSRWYPIESPYAPIALYAALCLVGAAVCFAFSSAIIGRTMKLIAAIERRWDAMPTQQIVLTSIGMIMGLVVAALITQLILSAGASLITISFSALTYVVLGYVGLRIGFHRYRGGKTPRMRRHLRRAAEAGILDDADLLMTEEGEDEEECEAIPAARPSRKYLDTSVIIDGAGAGYRQDRLSGGRYRGAAVCIGGTAPYRRQRRQPAPRAGPPGLGCAGQAAKGAENTHHCGRDRLPRPGGGGRQAPAAVPGQWRHRGHQRLQPQ